MLSNSTRILCHLHPIQLDFRKTQTGSTSTPSPLRGTCKVHLRVIFRLRSHPPLKSFPCNPQPLTVLREGLSASRLLPLSIQLHPAADFLLFYCFIRRRPSHPFIPTLTSMRLDTFPASLLCKSLLSKPIVLLLSPLSSPNTELMFRHDTDDGRCYSYVQPTCCVSNISCLGINLVLFLQYILSCHSVTNICI